LSGIFLSVEGGEGVGKSLFCKKLVEVLGARVGEIISTREPGGTGVAKAIREIFLNPIDDEVITPVAEMLLVSAARSQHVEHLIRPALDRGCWVVCDRFYDSTRVYQGRVVAQNNQILESVIGLSVAGVHPDITFLLDCDTEVVMERLRGRSQNDDPDRFDSAGESFHSMLRASFLEVAKTNRERFSVLDATRGADNIVEQAVTTLVDRGLISF